MSKENDRSLRFYNEVLGLDHLHYGIWEEAEALTLENLKRAQQRYEDMLVGRLPAPPATVLDVGCGTSALCQRLRAEGYAPEGLSPERSQGEHFRQELDLPFHACRFEHFEPARQYDVVVMSESCQYVPVDAIMGKVQACLKPGGSWLIFDYFVTDGAEGRLAKSGHRLSRFRELADAAGFITAEAADHTEAASRTLELASDIADRALIAGDLLTEKWRTKHPVLTRLVRRLARKKWAKLEADRVLIDAAAFRQHKRYMLFHFRSPT